MAKKRYRAITQKPYCCVPACLSMILNRRKIQHKSQVEIGIDLGLTVPKKDLKLFPEKYAKGISTWPKPSAGWGTQIQEREYGLNNYFRKNKLNLKYSYVFPKNTKTVKGFVEKALSSDIDLIACFNYKALWGGNSGNWGHVSLIESLSDNKVTLVEPEKKLPRRRDADLDRLIAAMIRHGRKHSGGFWVISKS